MSLYDRAVHWLGPTWLCLDCGRVLHKPPLLINGNRYHATGCESPMVPVNLEWPR